MLFGEIIEEGAFIAYCVKWKSASNTKMSNE